MKTTSLMRSLKKAALESLKPYLVYVQSGEFDGVSHKAWTQAEAREWMACYPNE